MSLDKVQNPKNASVKEIVHTNLKLSESSGTIRIVFPKLHMILYDNN